MLARAAQTEVSKQCQLCVNVMLICWHNRNLFQLNSIRKGHFLKYIWPTFTHSSVNDSFAGILLLTQAGYDLEKNVIKKCREKKVCCEVIQEESEDNYKIEDPA